MSVIINGSNTPTAGGVTYGNGTEYATTTSGIAGQVLTSTGSSAPVWAAGGSGSGGSTATGNVTLTSSSDGAQSITPTSYGNTVTLPDATTMNKAACVFNIKNNGGYPVRVANASGGVLGFIAPYDTTTIGLADNSTAAGSWVASDLQCVAITAQLFNETGQGARILQSIVVDSDRVFILVNRPSGAAGLYGVVYNSTTSTWGSLTLIDSAPIAGSVAVACVKVATDSILVGFYATTTNGVVCSLSGTTITVNSKTSVSGTGMSATWCAFATVGSTYVVHSSSNYSQAFTVSGTTVSIGTSVVFSNSTNDVDVGRPYLVVHSSSVYLVFSYVSGTTAIICAGSVSGTTITKGTNLSISTVSGMGTSPFGVVGSNYFYAYSTSSGIQVSIISVSGTTCTASTVVGLTNSNSSLMGVLVSGDKLILAATDASNLLWKFNVVTNTGGTASAGTEITYPYTTQNTAVRPVGFSTLNGYAVFLGGADTYMNKFVIDYSGASPVISRLDRLANNIFGSNSFASSSYVSTNGYAGLLGSRPAYILTGRAVYNVNTYQASSGILEVSDTATYLKYPGDLFKYLYQTPGEKNNEGWFSNWVRTSTSGCIISRMECATV